MNGNYFRILVVATYLIAETYVVYLNGIPEIRAERNELWYRSLLEEQFGIYLFGEQLSPREVRKWEKLNYYRKADDSFLKVNKSFRLAARDE